MNFLKRAFGGSKKIEKLIGDLWYVSPERSSLIETRRKLGDELIMANARGHGFPTDLMIQDHILSEAIIKAEEGDEKVRAKAAQELGDLKASEAVPQLITSMNTNFPAVRLNAAIALGKIGDQRATAELEKIITNEGGEQKLRQAAQQALQTLRSSKVD